METGSICVQFFPVSMPTKSDCDQLNPVLFSDGFPRTTNTSGTRPILIMMDLVATWEVPLYDKVHKVEFEHGTTTGRRVLWVDGEVMFKKDWMFKLVGSETFEIKDPSGEEVYAKCEIMINACLGFTYEYVLYVNGKQFKTFREKQSKIMHAWHFDLNTSDGGVSSYRVVLEKDTLDVWVNGQKKQTNNDFGDSEGTEITFFLDDDPQDPDKGPVNRGCIRTKSSGDKRKGMCYVLEVNDQPIEDKGQQ